MASGAKKQSYTISYKLQVIEYAKQQQSCKEAFWTTSNCKNHPLLEEARGPVEACIKNEM